MVTGYQRKSTLDSQSWIDRLAFECEDAEDAFVDPVERLVVDEPLGGS
jgi:hypothetical protein